MKKELDALFHELSLIKRDSKQKKESLQLLLNRIEEDKNSLRRTKLWRPMITVVMFGFVCCLFFLISQSPTTTVQLSRGEDMISSLQGNHRYIQTINVSSSHSLNYFPRDNANFYFGMEKKVDPFQGVNTELKDLLLTAKPIQKQNIQPLFTIIRDVQVNYTDHKSHLKGTLFLKIIFIDTNKKLLYIKDMKNDKWYKIEGAATEKLQTIKAASSFPNSLFGLLNFYAPIFLISFLVGLIIKDKFPIIKRTPKYVDKKHQWIDRSIVGGGIVILTGSIYYLGVIHVLFVFLIPIIILIYRFYREFNFRAENKRQYLIINEFIVFVLFMIGYFMGV